MFVLILPETDHGQRKGATEYPDYFFRNRASNKWNA